MTIESGIYAPPLRLAAHIPSPTHWKGTFDSKLTSALFSISHLCSIFIAKIWPLSLCLTTAT